MKSIALTKDEVQLARREQIFAFEDAIKKIPDHYEGDNERCQLKHSFTDGIYVREIRIPAGEFITGKIHKHEHPNFLMSGTVLVHTEGGGSETLTGPLAMISPPGTKRALYAVTDLWWITIHSNRNNCEDLEEIEGFVIAKDYDEYEKFRKRQKLFSFMNRIKSFVFVSLFKALKSCRG